MSATNDDDTKQPCDRTPSGRSKIKPHPNLACTFCDKTVGEVKYLIAGPRRQYICDDCVDICNDIISEADKDERGTSASDPTIQEGDKQ